MSIAEMKLEVINKVSKIESENALKEILQHLASINAVNDKPEPFDLNQFFDAAVEKYGTVLQKLAQ